MILFPLKKRRMAQTAGIVFASIVAVFLPIESNAQIRGIGVTPAKIEVQNEESPYTSQLFVTNLSSEREWVEITFEERFGGGVFIEPSRFSLGAGARKRILLRFEYPGQKESSGKVRIAAARTSPEGLEAGAGIEIPFQISGVSPLFLGQKPKDAHGEFLAAGFQNRDTWKDLNIAMAGFFFLVTWGLWKLSLWTTRLLFARKENVSVFPATKKYRVEQGMIKPGEIITFHSSRSV